MRKLYDSSVASITSHFGHIADRAAATAPSALRAEFGSLRNSLEPLIDGYRYAAIGVTGVVDRDKSQSIASLLAREVVERERLTTTIARVTRDDVVMSEGGSRIAPSGRSPRPQSLNIWPSVRAEDDVVHEVDQLELLHWLRRENEFTVVTFDNLGDVFTRIPLARRLDGMIVVNSGRDTDLDLMHSAIEILERRQVRILGQIRNITEEHERDLGVPSDVA